MNRNELSNTIPAIEIDEDLLSRLDVVTVKEDEGVYLAELLVVVKEGTYPHHFCAAGHTEANARLRLRGSSMTRQS